jgi:ABC-type transport system involved in multi-copper enzyme maturation permease subunit
MLWYKSWLETRSRFLIGLVLLMFSAVGVVMFYPRLLTLLPQVNRVDVGGELGRRIKEGAELVHTYRGYVWSQWLRQSMSNMLTLFAVLLGAGGLLSQASRGGAVFTLSLPVSRNRVVGIRAATGLAELLVLAVVPVLLFPLLSPAVGETYGIGDALVHGACLFIAGGVVFSLTFLLSTVFSDLWRPVLIASGAAAVLGLCDPFFPALSRYGLFGIMSGEVYFRGGGLPWLGLLASAGASGAMLYAASRNIARQDF